MGSTLPADVLGKRHVVSFHLANYVDELYERLARDAYSGYLATFGEEMLRAICWRMIEEMDDMIMIDAPYDPDVVEDLKDEWEKGRKAGLAQALEDGADRALWTLRP